MTEIDGDVKSSYSYDAFGNLQGDILNSDTKYLYTGQQYDFQTELYSLRARYYDPSLGRFTSRDTWAYDYQNPIELNRYVYAAGNPTMYTDPSGNAVLTLYAGGHTPAAENTDNTAKLGLVDYAITAVVVIAIIAILMELTWPDANTYPPQNDPIEELFSDIKNGIDNIPWEDVGNIIRGVATEAVKDLLERKIHIALGRYDTISNKYMTDFLDSLAGRTDLVPADVEVLPYSVWAQEGLIDSVANPDWQQVDGRGENSGFGKTLKTAMNFVLLGLVGKIHFNLEGFESGYSWVPSLTNKVDQAIYWANQYGNGGSFILDPNQQISVTAVELSIVRNNPMLCAVTDFYVDTFSSQSIRVVSAWDKWGKLCNPVYQAPSPVD